MSKTLVTYASQHGSTAEIAQRITDVLTKNKIEVDLIPVSEVEDISDYDNILVGSGVYMGMWLKPAKQFVKKNAQDLAKKSVWIFSSGPTGEGDPVELMQGWEYPTAIKQEILQIKPKEYTIFHGNVDLDKLGMLQKWIIKNVKAPVGDFRDWDMIEAWAKKIANSIG